MNKLKILIIFVLCIFAVSVMLTGCIGLSRQEINESVQLSLEDVDALDVEFVSGNVVFVESDNARVTLKGKIRTNAPQDSYLAVYDEGSKVRVVLLERKLPLNFRRTDIEMTIYLPKENMLNLDVQYTSGNLEMDDMQFGNMTIRSSSGNASITNVTANAVDYRLTSGNTTFRSCAFDSLIATCSSGSVKIYDTVTDTQVECSSGTVVLDGIDGAVDVKATSGSVTVTMANADIEPINISITSGNCKLYLYEDSAFDLVAKVTSGKINFDMPVQISGSQSRKEMNGTVNGGGVMVDLKSTSGNVTILTID